jgi:hypothetical protein
VYTDGVSQFLIYKYRIDKEKGRVKCSQEIKNLVFDLMSPKIRKELKKIL